ncbi:hypothetical protein JKF63_01235 [Porcisia hertigi]|uniref:SET domain-containing protein n=1 Tax=Porcisia hertigi TaxID=2761500 RepID=A0A836I8X7_9TRYP|nr:hypothetical protein JKF63_01235 [Porcisia hertigi]
MASAPPPTVTSAATPDDPSPSLPPTRATTRCAGLNVLRGLQCTPSRRAVKFVSSWHARQFLAFDSAISRDERLLLFMEIFAFRHHLVDRRVLPDFRLAAYTPEELLEIRVITDPRHPAYGQAGLFAKSTIPSNTIVTPYSGFIEVFATSCNSRTYTMGFGALGDDYALDAEFVGNYGRFANDPRGVGALQANLSAENRFSSRGESFTALVSRRQINAGEEILMSYGKAHRLSATAWANLQEKPIMRPRLGGVVPFPSFRTGSVPAAAAALPESPVHSSSSRRGAAEGVKTEDKGSSDGSGLATCSAAASASLPFCSTYEADCPAGPPMDSEWAIPSASDPDQRQPRVCASVANDLLWECTQCGMWSICEASTADAPQPCGACATPKLSGARLVSLLSSPSITQAGLLAEAGLGVQGLSDASPNPPRQAQAADATTVSSSGFSSEHTDWPMNVPFLPWQVWDAAVPLSVLAEHSRFETQEHMFVYTVDTGLDQEKRGRGVHDASAAAVTPVSQKSLRTTDTEGSPETPPSKVSRLQPQSCDADDGSLEKMRAHDEHPAAPQMNPRGGSGRGSAAHKGNRLKRSVLWERQDDLDLEEMALLSPGMSALPLIPPATPAPYPAFALGFASPLTKPPFSGRPAPPNGEGVVTDGDVAITKMRGSRGSPDSNALAATSLTRSPLSYLLSTTQEVDRLVILHRAVSREYSQADKTSYSLQMAHVRRRLQCMTRRLFTGKAFQPGEVVSYVGGLVRQRGDTRCRVSNSCLEIPLRFFLPLRLRLWCGREPASADSEDWQCDPAEEESLQTFCDRLDTLSLVVTNEFMYCPCLVLEAKAGMARAAASTTEASGSACDTVGCEDEVDDALESCNVALVLTLDALGSPFACAVAIKPIGAFEPLLARAQ